MQIEKSYNLDVGNNSSLRVGKLLNRLHWTMRFGGKWNI